jgi:uncharacterized protein (DUF885 family)
MRLHPHEVSSLEFSKLVDQLLAGFFEHYPTAATEIGNHAHDDRWPDLTDAGREARLAFLADAQRRLDELDGSALSRDEAIDRRILQENLGALRFNEETLREETWSPLSYVYLFGGGLFSLLAREFAPLPDRLRSAAARLRALPAALDAARAILEAGGDRPISRFHTERAVATMPGVADLARRAADEAKQLDDAELRGEVEAAAQAAIASVDGFGRWLADELLPRTDGDFRLGPELYAQKFRHALKTDLTPDDLLARAQAGFVQVRAEMTRLARQLWPTWIGKEPEPIDGNVLVRRVLDAIAADHPTAGELLDFCEAELRRIEEFIGRTDLIGLADEPLEIIWTPEFLRAFGGAMLMPPGALDRGLSSFFAITPMPDDWTDEQRESYLREDNARMLRLLTIHEAVPGHYLQLAFSNRCASLARAVFQSGVFAEGWAVYVTQVMMDVGYGADDPALLLVHWKFYLRSITNAMMDIRIHTGSMDRDEAMRLMVTEGFQEESEAANKWDRARLSSTQLCEYFLGAVGMTELEAEARRRAQVNGAPFTYRPFLEGVLAHGTPSLPVIRDILYGQS